MENKRVILTGASGYIGQKLSKKLVSSGYEVHALVRNDSDLLTELGINQHVIPVEITALASLLESISPDSLFHLAALYLGSHEIDDAWNLIESNLVFPSKILEASYRAKIPQIFLAGTVVEHYDNKSYNPACLYAAQKRAVADIARYYSMQGQMKFLHLKIYETFGSDDPRPKILNRLVSVASQGGVLSLSNPHQRLHMVHVDDAVSAFCEGIEILEHSEESFQEYRLCAEEEISLKEIVDCISRERGEDCLVDWQSHNSELTVNLWEGDPEFPLKSPSPKTRIFECIKELISLNL